MATQNDDRTGSIPTTARVVTRHHMLEIVQEQDLFDRGPEALGRLVGADLLILGRITPYRDEVHVSAQLLAVADGVELGAVREELQRTNHVNALLVPPPVPSDFQSSEPCSTSKAVKKHSPSSAVKLEGNELAAPSKISLI